MAFDLVQAVRDAKPGDVVRVPAGNHAVTLILDKPLTLLGVGQAVLDGRHGGCVVRITTDGTVKLAGLMIVGGAADEAGGGVCHLAGSLELTDCTLRFNKAPQYGGGGLYTIGKEARVTRCRFEANTGRQGGGILVDDAAVLTLRDSTLIQNAAVDGGGLRVKEGARAELLGCTLADNKVVGDGAKGGALSLAGTTTRAPSVSLSHCIVSERASGPELFHNFPAHPGALAFTRCLLPEWAQGVGGDNLFGPADFTLTGSEPYLLRATSKAVGAGEPAAFEAKAKDLNGQPRLAAGRKPDLGAFALVR